jgi:hypothetical protein
MPEFLKNFIIFFLKNKHIGILRILERFNDKF